MRPYCHFHDLRREAGSRWLEAGIPLHVVRDWLGHENIAQTSTYLAGTVKGREDAMRMYAAEYRERLQQSQRVQNRGRKSERTAKGREKRLNKTAEGRNAAIM